MLGAAEAKGICGPEYRRGGSSTTGGGRRQKSLHRNSSGVLAKEGCGLYVYRMRLCGA